MAFRRWGYLSRVPGRPWLRPRIDVLAFANHDDTRVGHGVTVGPVVLEVVADHARFRDLHVRPDDSAPDPAIAADLGAVHNNRTLHFAVAVNEHPRRQHASYHAPARDDAAARYDRIDRHAHAPSLLREHKF